MESCKKKQAARKAAGKRKKRAFGGSDAYICLYLSGDRTAEIRIDSLPAFIEIHPFYEEEFRREKENASRTEQGISLFLKEGRVVFFRIHEEACDD